MNPYGFQVINGRLVDSDIFGFWTVGDTPDPSIPNMALENSSAGAAGANFAGAAAITFGQSGALRAAASMSGAATATFAQAGVFRGASSFVGATTVTFDQSSVLRGASNFAGATTVTFGQTGDFVAGAAGAAGAVFEGSASITFDQSGDFTAGAANINKGDDARRGVKPIVRIRPKIERDLDDALEIIETIAPERRVKENKLAAKTALAAIRAVEIPISFAEPIDKIEKSLKRLVRDTAKHEGMEETAMQIAGELEAVIAEMQRRRKRRQREEEEIVLWLLT